MNQMFAFLIFFKRKNELMERMNFKRIIESWLKDSRFYPSKKSGTIFEKQSVMKFYLVVQVNYQILQQQQKMASKNSKIREIVGIRITRRSRIVIERESRSLSPQNNENQLNQCLHNHPLQEHKSQQLKQKNEFESLSPQNNEVLSVSNMPENARMMTACLSTHSNKRAIQSDSQQEQITPDNNNPTKTSPDLTCKKITKQKSVPELAESKLNDSYLTVKKNSFKSSQFLSPYNQERKSYRKSQRKQICSVPYRKCHDLFEGRIVTIINKMEWEKNCLKDFEGLVQKMQRISTKDMMNKYIISGIKTIIRMAKEKSFCEVTSIPMKLKIIERLEMEMKNLIDKINKELDCFDYYENIHAVEEEEKLDSKDYKNKVIKAVYKILKSTYPHKTKGSLREYCSNACEEFFRAEVNISKTISFIKGIQNICFQ